ncbi:hypothetical protein RRG08_031014 [Elysia crispata]|uniref:Uncharacterized protein n=1 Tax=Elysia crispata TaxID=231223 RepID=A0AAE1ADB0_9GAST|nr:hypothetical protein RRG08_031014 [Elysia crispata]
MLKGAETFSPPHGMVIYYLEAQMPKTRAIKRRARTSSEGVCDILKPRPRPLLRSRAAGILEIIMFGKPT